MASKAKADVKVLKGQDGASYNPSLCHHSYPLASEAENKVLDYIKRVRKSYSSFSLLMYRAIDRSTAHMAPSTYPPTSKAPSQKQPHRRSF